MSFADTAFFVLLALLVDLHTKAVEFDWSEAIRFNGRLNDRLNEAAEFAIGECRRLNERRAQAALERMGRIEAERIEATRWVSPRAIRPSFHSRQLEDGCFQRRLLRPEY